MILLYKCDGCREGMGVAKGKVDVTPNNAPTTNPMPKVESSSMRPGTT
jgi:hypothetical protein